MCNSCGIHLVGGTGSAPQLSNYSYYSQYGAVSGDTFPFPHVISFCKPSAGIWFNEKDEPPRYQCGDYVRNLDAYPLNDATLHDSITGNWKFGTSEMVLVFVRLENYPSSGGYLKMDFKNPAGQIFYTFQKSLPLPDPNWTWWYAWVWAVAGRFDKTSGFSGDEIVVPGAYRTVVSSPWGSANIDYDVTGPAPPPPPTITISSLYAEYQGSGKIFIQWNQAGAGTVKVWVNGMYDLFTGKDSTNTYTLTGMLPGTHSLCVEGNNKLCTSVTISPPPPPPVACGNIPVDSWSITTNNPATGAKVPFTIRSKDPNKHFLIQSNVLGGLNTLMTDGTTDSTGCFTGELNALPDGTYNVFVCYDVLGICPFGANIGTKGITWGTKPPLSIDDIIKYAPYLIGAWAVATIAGAMRR